jgi:hypothetical protein
LLLVSFVLESRLTRLRILIKVEILVVLGTTRSGQNDRLEAYPTMLSGAWVPALADGILARSLNASDKCFWAAGRRIHKNDILRVALRCIN